MFESDTNNLRASDKDTLHDDSNIIESSTYPAVTLKWGLLGVMMLNVFTL